MNCSGLNQCHNCSNNYILHDDIARKVCILPCDNGSFYNETSDQCESEFAVHAATPFYKPLPLACAAHCKRCIPSLGCVECEHDYVINDNFCLLGEIT